MEFSLMGKQILYTDNLYNFSKLFKELFFIKIFLGEVTIGYLKSAFSNVSAFDTVRIPSHRNSIVKKKKKNVGSSAHDSLLNMQNNLKYSKMSCIQLILLC